MAPPIISPAVLGSTAFPKTNLFDPGIFGNSLLHVQNVQASGVNGGSATADAFTTVDLNTVLTNEIAGASLAANEITLPAGDYWIEVSSPSFRTLENFCKLYNVTASSDILIGSSDYRDNAATNTDPETGKSFIFGRFTLNVQSDIRLDHSVDNTFSTSDLGLLSSSGGLTRAQEVYANVMIWRLN